MSTTVCIILEQVANFSKIYAACTVPLHQGQKQKCKIGHQHVL